MFQVRFRSIDGFRMGQDTHFVKSLFFFCSVVKIVSIRLIDELK